LIVGIDGRFWTTSISGTPTLVTSQTKNIKYYIPTVDSPEMLDHGEVDHVGDSHDDDRCQSGVWDVEKERSEKRQSQQHHRTYTNTTTRVLVNDTPAYRRSIGPRSTQLTQLELPPGELHRNISSCLILAHWPDGMKNITPSKKNRKCLTYRNAVRAGFEPWP